MAAGAVKIPLTFQRTLTTSFIGAILDGPMAVATFMMMILYSRTLSVVVVVATVLLYALLRALAYRPLGEASQESLALSAKEQSCLVLDEATSHLDVQLEREVNAAVAALNITRIVVAHRPETSASARRVIALVGGEIVQDLELPSATSTVVV